MSIGRAACLLLFSMVVTAAVVAAGQRLDAGSESSSMTGPGEERYRLRLGSVERVPESGLHAVAVDSGAPFLIQLDRTPDATDRARLEEAGLDRVRSVGGFAYLGRCETSCDEALASALVRSTADLTLRPGDAFPVRARRVWQTGTSATGIRGLA